MGEDELVLFWVVSQSATVLSMEQVMSIPGTFLLVHVVQVEYEMSDVSMCIHCRTIAELPKLA